jgi:hypothetical protein
MRASAKLKFQLCLWLCQFAASPDFLVVAIALNAFQFQLSAFLQNARQRQAVISTFNFPRFSVLAFTPHIPPLPNPCKFL